MKKLTITAALVLTTAASVFAQGTVFLGSATGSGTSRVYGPSSTTPGLSLSGNASNDGPSGTVNYTAAGMLPIGAVGGLSASTTLAQLLAANGSNVAESSLTPMGQTTTFRTGGAAGISVNITTTLEGLNGGGGTPATLQMVAWDDSSGLYSTWTQASVAWQAGLIAAGMGNVMSVPNTGGGIVTSPSLPFQSFNLYIIPEPTTFALLGLGAAAMLVVRRRK